MWRATRAWRRFGEAPAVAAVVVLFGAGFVGRLAFGPSTGLSAALLAVFVAYCAARRSGGLDLFLLASAPNAAAAFLDEVLGLPGWPALLLLPLVLFLVHDVDADRERDGGAPPGAPP